MECSTILCVRKNCLYIEINTSIFTAKRVQNVEYNSVYASVLLMPLSSCVKREKRKKDTISVL